MLLQWMPKVNFGEPSRPKSSNLLTGRELGFLQPAGIVCDPNCVDEKPATEYCGS